MGGGGGGGGGGDVWVCECVWWNGYNRPRQGLRGGRRCHDLNFDSDSTRVTNPTPSQARVRRVAGRGFNSQFPLLSHVNGQTCFFFCLFCHMSAIGYVPTYFFFFLETLSGKRQGPPLRLPPRQLRVLSPSEPQL